VRSHAMFIESGAMLTLAQASIVAGQVELIAGDPTAAEGRLREGYEIFRGIGERGYLGTVTGELAEALYAQGRLNEAQEMIDQARETSTPHDIDAQVRWRAVGAKLLARNGQFSAARQLVSEADQLASPTSWAALQAEILLATAEVDRFARMPEEAAASLQAALRIYEEKRAVYMAEQVRASLANLADHLDPPPV
jgi:tetratricopeptide (TPR) repeat protein